MKVRRALWLLMSVSALAGPASAEDDPSPQLVGVASGDRVRLKTAGGKSLRATVESVTADEFVLRGSGAAEPIRFNLSQLESLDVSRGRGSHWRRGAVIGFVPGALFLGTIGGVFPCIDMADPCFASGWAVTGALIGGTITGSVGALVGLAFKTDHWVRVHEKRPKVSLHMAPTQGGTTTFGFSVSF
jgi:hypothetical protein